MKDYGLRSKERLIAVMMEGVMEQKPELSIELKKIINGTEIEGKELARFINEILGKYTYADRIRSSYGKWLPARF